MAEAVRDLSSKRAHRTIRPAACRTCTHPEREEIERLSVAGVGYRVLTRRFGVKMDAIYRHMRDHVTPLRRAELFVGKHRVEDLAEAAKEESRTLLEYLCIARGVFFRQFLESAEAGDRNGVAHVGARFLDALGRIGALTGELRTISAVTINNNLSVSASPQFGALAEGLLRIARSHREARGDILGLLESLGGLDGAEGIPGPSRARQAAILEGEAVDAGS